MLLQRINMIIHKLKQLIKPSYETLNRIEINKKAIFHNIKILQEEQPNVDLFPVLKANAYGHGLKEICTILNETNIKMVAVDSFPEAQIVYRYFNGKVLIIGEMPLDAYQYLNWKRTEVCVYNKKTLEKIVDLKKGAKVHLFINTGMNREGIKDLTVFINENKDLLLQVNVTGLCSHLSSAEADEQVNAFQLENFLKNLDIAERIFKNLKFIHLANSAGLFSVHHPSLTACRPGLAVYGYNPFEIGHEAFLRASKLQPALELYSSIVSIQNIKTGESVSYNKEFIAATDLKVVIIPFGYCEGLDRRLSNKASFKLKNSSYVKIAGNICMNLTCLALSGDDSIAIGEAVQIISSNNEDINSVKNLANIQQAIPYEVLVKLQANIRRIIIDK